MPQILVVDDERTLSIPGAIHVRNCADAKMRILASEESMTLFLDHDLGPEEDVRGLILWLVQSAIEGEDLNIDKIYVHSMNPVGAKWIVDSLVNYYDVYRIGLDGLL